MEKEKEKEKEKAKASDSTTPAGDEKRSPNASDDDDDDDAPEDTNYLKSEASRLKKENEALRKKAFLLEQSSSSHDPEKIEQLFERERLERETAQEQMKKDIPAMQDFLTWAFTEKDKIPDRLTRAVEEGHNNPENFQPIHELTTRAHLRQQNDKKEAEDNQRKREAEYQKASGKMKEELEQRKRHEAELYRSNEFLTKKLGYRNDFLGDGGADKNLSSSGKKARKRDDKENSSSSSSNKKQQVENGEWNDRWESGGDAIVTNRDVGAVKAPRRGFGMQESEEHIGWMAEIFGGPKPSIDSEKMGMFNVQNLVGRDYRVPEGVNPGTNEIPEGTYTLRSPGPSSLIPPPN